MEQRRLQDYANLFTTLPAMGVGMNVNDMASYPPYPSHYSYQVRDRTQFTKRKRNPGERAQFEFGFEKFGYLICRARVHCHNTIPTPVIRTWHCT